MATSIVTLSAYYNENPIEYYDYTGASQGKNKLDTSGLRRVQTSRLATGKYAIGSARADATVLQINVSDSDTNIDKTEWVIYEQHDISTPFIDVFTDGSWQNQDSLPQIVNAGKFLLEIILKHRSYYYLKVRFHVASGWTGWTELFGFKTRDKSYALPDNTVKTRGQNGGEIISHLTPEQARNNTFSKERNMDYPTFAGMVQKSISHITLT